MIPHSTIVIDMDRLCVECGKGGASPSDLCLKCSTRAMDPKTKMKSKQGMAVQERWQQILRKPFTKEG